MKDDAVVARIRKYLALATSPNVNEAAIARTRADELLVKLGLREEDVVNPLAAKIGEHQLPEHHDFKMDWRFALLTVFAKRFGCRALRIQDAYHWRGAIVGPKDVADVIIETFLEIDEQLRRRAMTDFQQYVQDIGHQPMRAWKMSYCLGAAYAIQRRVLTHQEPIVVDFAERKKVDAGGSADGAAGSDELRGGVETTRAFTAQSTQHLRDIVGDHIKAQYPQAGRFRRMSASGGEDDRDVEGYRSGFDAGMQLLFPGSQPKALAAHVLQAPAAVSGTAEVDAHKAVVVLHNEPPTRAEVEIVPTKPPDAIVEFFAPTMFTR